MNILARPKLHEYYWNYPNRIHYSSNHIYDCFIVITFFVSLVFILLLFLNLTFHKPLTSNSDSVRCGRHTQISACSSSHMNEIGGTKIQRTSDPGSGSCTCSAYSDVVGSVPIVTISHTRETRRWRRPRELRSPATNLSGH